MKARFLPVILATTILLSQAACTKTQQTSLPAYASYELKDQDGKPFRLASMKGRPVFATFVFTRCPMPDMCPLAMTLNKRLHRALSEKGDDSLRFLIVTIDPEHDTPTVLKEYAARQSLDSSTFTLVTGDDETITKFASEVANVVAFPSGGTVSHNMKSVLLGPDLQTVAEFKDNEWKPEDVIAKLGSPAASE